MSVARSSTAAALAALVLSCVVGALRQSGAAAQDEPLTHLLSESFDYTEVADALDGDDPFDLNVRVGFERTVTTGTLQREAVADTASAGGSRRVALADSEIATSTLSLGLEAGVFRDLMVYARIPLVLSEQQKLDLASSAKCSQGPCDAVDSLLRDAPKDAANGSHRLLVLDPTFNAATRSGVPHFDFGAAWAVTNQYRSPGFPTWVIVVEGRLPVGAVMKPCAADGSCDAGISRGTARVKVDTRFSYRVRYLEPFFGLSHAMEWATTASERFAPSAGLPSYVDATPPTTSEATLGLVIVPWEERGRFQRFGIDLRGTAAYVSAGRDYTPLFDAVGSSDSPQLTAFDGLTQVGAYAKLGIEAALVIQAAQYVRFRLGARLVHGTAHLLSGADGCDTSGAVHATTTSRGGSCEDNPLYVPVIDLPGQRFVSAGTWELGLSALAVGQF